MELLRGKPVSQSIEKVISSFFEVERYVLSVYLIGADPSSRIYASSKVKKGNSMGAEVILKEFPPDVDQDTILHELEKDSKDETITGMMIERPLPDHLDMDTMMNMIPPEKDVEGLHPRNYGSMAMGCPTLIPPTPLGALFMLRFHGIETEGKRITVIGRSPNVGRPLSILLSQKKIWGNATVTLVHSRSKDIPEILRGSDIIITAAGRKGLVTGKMVKDGAVLIDLGINPEGKGIVGDVDIPTLEGMDVRVTPTPGGTGPVTVSSMFLNLVVAGSMQRERSMDFPGMIREIYGSIAL